MLWWQLGFSSSIQKYWFAKSSSQEGTISAKQALVLCRHFQKTHFIFLRYEICLQPCGNQQYCFRVAIANHSLTKRNNSNSGTVREYNSSYLRPTTENIPSFLQNFPKVTSQHSTPVERKNKTFNCDRVTMCKRN